MFHVLVCLLMCFTMFDRSILPHIIDHFFARKFKLSERIHNVVSGFNCLCIKDNKEVAIFVISIYK